jgi:hypothetical protein
LEWASFLKVLVKLWALVRPVISRLFFLFFGGLHFVVLLPHFLFSRVVLWDARPTCDRAQERLWGVGCIAGNRESDGGWL